MFDSHCHLNFKAFQKDCREVVSRSFSQGINGLMIVGSNFETSQRAIKIAKEFPNCYVALGLHPIHVIDEKFNQRDYHFQALKNIGIIKAIGETGFDFFHQPFDREKQKEVFLKHLELAKEFNLPVILHCRGEESQPPEAYHQLLLVISNLSFRPRGVIHCFSADWQIAQKFLDLGFYIGFTGIITFKNRNDYLLEVVEKVPLEKTLIETDAPYLAPEPYRGQRCEPWQVKFTAQKIAEIKKVPEELVIKEASNNAQKLFKIL